MTEEGSLAQQFAALGRGKEADFAISPVVPPGDMHLAPAHPVDAVPQEDSPLPGHVGKGRPAQDLQFRPQPVQEPEVSLAHFFAAGVNAQDLGQDDRQGNQGLKRPGRRRGKPVPAVGQLQDAMHHPQGQGFAAPGAETAQALRLFRLQPEAAMPVAVQVVLAFLGKKLDGAAEALPGAQGPGQLGINRGDLKYIGLPAQFLGRVGVGVGHQQEAVQVGDPPVHGGIGRQAGLHRIDVGGARLEALLQGIEAALAAQNGKPGGPDVGRNHQGPGIDLQDQFQHEPGVQAQDGAAVGSHVAQAAQALGELLGRGQIGEHQEQVDLAHLAGLFINGAHFAGDHEAHRGHRFPWRSREVQGHGQTRFEGVHPRRRRLEFGGQVRQPLGMGAIAGAHHLHPLITAPEIQVLQVGVPAGGDGEMRMDMQVGDDFHFGHRPYHKTRGTANVRFQGFKS